jgi:hypothetical protein
MDKVYIVLIDSYDGEGSPIIDMEVFKTLNAAKEHLNICVEDFKKDVINWDDTDVYTVEETDVSFTWYESGYYEQNHYCVDIYERTIYDGTIKVGGN